MYFEDALKVLLRRWYVVVAGLLLTLVAAVAAILLVPTDYEATGEMLLLLPADVSSDGVPVNPYVNLPPALSVAASLVASNVMSKDTQRAMTADGFTSDYSIGLDPTAGPLLVLTAEDTDAKAALATRDEVIRRLNSELARFQAEKNVATNQLISANPVNVSSKAEVLPGSRIRALAVIGAAGIVITLLSAFTLDRLRTRRRSGYDRSVASGGSSRRGDDAEDIDEQSARSRGSRRKNGTDNRSNDAVVHDLDELSYRKAKRKDRDRVTSEVDVTGDHATRYRRGTSIPDETEDRGRASHRMRLSVPRSQDDHEIVINGNGGAHSGRKR